MMSNDILEYEVGGGVNMTVIEFAENFLGLKLLHYQKLLLEKMSDLPKGSKIVYGRWEKVYLIKGNKNE